MCYAEVLTVGGNTNDREGMVWKYMIRNDSRVEDRIVGLNIRAYDREGQVLELIEKCISGSTRTRG
jgi:hypothetical protein